MVKFDSERFLELISIAKPKIVYRRNNKYFFAYDGFVTYCDRIDEKDIPAKIIDAIEFSNYTWKK
jgi:hypothetical protein